MVRLPPFPNPVNDKAARVVAAGVAIIAVVVLATGWYWLVAFVALGFLLRVLAGPRWSPLALLATRVIAPRLGEPNLVPGPPKRFAQSIGFVFSTAAALSALIGENTAVAAALMSILLLFATLESILGFCAGCWLFRLLIRVGVIPESVCVACNDIRVRVAQPT